MGRREVVYGLSCTHPGCKEIGAARYDSQREARKYSDKRSKWRCLRHTYPDDVLSESKPGSVVTLVNEQLKHGLFWNGRYGFVYGDGFKAYSADFPVGTKLIVTSQIVLPEFTASKSESEAEKFRDSVPYRNWINGTGPDPRRPGEIGPNGCYPDPSEMD